MVAVTEITSLKLTSAMYHHKIPILITSTISLYTTPFIPHLLLALVTLDKPINITSQDTIWSVPILLYYAPPISCPILSVEGDGEAVSTTIQVANTSIYNWIWIDNSWYQDGQSRSGQCHFINLFTTEDTNPLFCILHPTASAHIVGPMLPDSANN